MMGFSLTGRVINKVGKGVAGVTVLVDRDEKALTDKVWRTLSSRCAGVG